MKKLAKQLKQPVTKNGFTLIEVMLTLAVSGLIFVGLVAGLSGMVARQRYNRDVDEFVEFLRNAYSEASNPQGADSSSGTSTTDALYGRMIVLAKNSTSNAQVIRDYLVVGSADIDDASGNYNLEDLESMTTTQIDTYEADLNLRIKPNTFDDFSSSDYNVRITTPEDTSEDTTDLPIAAILIMRNLSGGSVRTYLLDCGTGGGGCSITYRQGTGSQGGSIYFDFATRAATTTATTGSLYDESSDAVRFPLSAFTDEEIDLCVSSSDSNWAGGTRDVRITAGGTNSSAVQLIEQDSEDNRCV